ncbi:alpha/beta-hydrolase [Ascodesmis nigricans]|uniref:Alpha/beta-hydrolase n=1 Tax=Ascodesmis nigricans TaxID=341454 RepID=A0A4V3SHY2_9PEZI|nr:alpha/beta-hydrolase [Ascodesmis nigricans]
MNRPRWTLVAEANMWRGLMAMGMYLHRLAPPAPPNYTFYRRIPATLSKFRGQIGLYIYTPPTYYRSPADRFPAVVNFHGGGFTLGAPCDDARWAVAVIRDTNAIFIDVEYRLAPEYPFPTAVEDGADALLWLFSTADELKVDSRRVAVSGFSAGGNMCFSVPLRFYYEASMRPKQYEGAKPDSLATIAAFYPSTDFTRPRAERRATNIRPDKELPQVFTDLFDASYLWPPKEIDVQSPYLSPGVADNVLIREGLPERINMITCEWDELLAEGERFRDRLLGMGKKIWYEKVLGVPHGWDKNPNPFVVDQKAEDVYKRMCEQINLAFAEATGTAVEEAGVPVTTTPTGNEPKEPPQTGEVREGEI